jgi:hypothetical protein
LQGITFYTPYPEKTHVYINRSELKDEERNLPDYTGKKSVTIPLKHLPPLPDVSDKESLNTSLRNPSTLPDVKSTKKSSLRKRINYPAKNHINPETKSQNQPNSLNPSQLFTRFSSSPTDLFQWFKPVT